jgi:hypothetical protein
MFNFISGCIFGRLSTKAQPPTGSRSPNSIASEMVTIILSADTPYTLEKQLNEIVFINSWSENIAIAIYHGLENAIKSGADMAQAATDAVAKSKDAAANFTSDHPFYAGLIALGVLALLTPWALELLGFGELGPIEGSFATWWQTKYAGDVPKRALFGYFQRLGMKWHWTF